MLKIKYKILMILFLSFLGVKAAVVTVAFGEFKPPYVFLDAKKGLEIDIFKEALAHKGHELKVKSFPKKRLNEELLNTTNIDAVTVVNSYKNKNYFFVPDFIYYQNFAVSRKDDSLKIQKVLDLKDKRIIAWQNAHEDLGEEFYKLYKPYPPRLYKKKYLKSLNQLNQNKMFWHGRAEVIIIDKTIFQWHRKFLAKQIDTSKEVVFHNIFDKKTTFGVLFKDENLAKDFKEGLEYIKSSGLYKEIYKKYLY